MLVLVNRVLRKTRITTYLDRVPDNGYVTGSGRSPGSNYLPIMYNLAITFLTLLSKSATRNSQILGDILLLLITRHS